jgi:hypothetical protein
MNRRVLRRDGTLKGDQKSRKIRKRDELKAGGGGSIRGLI